MSKPIITACPSMVNPEAIGTVQELRAELHRANQHMLTLSSELHSLRGITQRVSSDLAKLVVDHMTGNSTAVRAHLEEISNQYVDFAMLSKQGRH